MFNSLYGRKFKKTLMRIGEYADRVADGRDPQDPDGADSQEEGTRFLLYRSSSGAFDVVFLFDTSHWEAYEDLRKAGVKAIPVLHGFLNVRWEKGRPRLSFAGLRAEPINFYEVERLPGTVVNEDATIVNFSYVLNTLMLQRPDLFTKDTGVYARPGDRQRSIRLRPPSKGIIWEPQGRG
jgi:hypothetical protein